MLVATWNYLITRLKIYKIYIYITHQELTIEKIQQMKDYEYENEKRIKRKKEKEKRMNRKKRYDKWQEKE